MPTYIFNGKVLPGRASVTIGPIEPVTAVIPDISLRFQAAITICASQILIAVNIDNSIKDLETKRSCAILSTPMGTLRVEDTTSK